MTYGEMLFQLRTRAPDPVARSGFLMHVRGIAIPLIMTRRNAMLLAGGLLASTACAHQKPATQLLPAALVAALSGDGPRATQQRYTVDSLPSEFPKALRPSGVRIVGGLTRGSQTLGVFADSSRLLAPVFDQLALQMGLRHPPVRPNSGFSSSGYGGSGRLCNDSALVYIAPTSDPHVVTVSYQQLRGMGCDARDRGPDLVIPALKPPPGVRVGISGGGYGSDVHASADVTGTDLTPGPILDFYAAQLVAAGWKADAPAVSDRVAAQFFEARSTAGQPWEGTMIVIGSGTSLSLTINMRPKAR